MECEEWQSFVEIRSFFTSEFTMKISMTNESKFNTPNIHLFRKDDITNLKGNAKFDHLALKNLL